MQGCKLTGNNKTGTRSEIPETTPAATKREELMAVLLEKNAEWLEQLDDIVLKQKDTEEHIGAVQKKIDSM